MGNICQTETEQESSLSIKNENSVAVQEDKKPTKNFTSALDQPQQEPRQEPEKKEAQQPKTNDTQPPVVEKKKMKKKRKIKKRKRDINDYVDAFAVKDKDQMTRNAAARLIQRLFREWKKKKEEEKNSGWFF